MLSALLSLSPSVWNQFQTQSHQWPLPFYYNTSLCPLSEATHQECISASKLRTLFSFTMLVSITNTTSHQQASAKSSPDTEQNQVTCWFTCTPSSQSSQRAASHEVLYIEPKGPGAHLSLPQSHHQGVRTRPKHNNHHQRGGKASN